MSVKYAFLKKAVRLLNFQKIMAQPYNKPLKPPQRCQRSRQCRTLN